MSAAPIADELNRSVTAEDMARIWEYVLEQSPIDPHDNFFDLGGDSLLAIRIFAEIAHRTGRELPITTIYDAPTAAALVSLLERGARPTSSPLVLLKPGADETPLFILHGLGGTVVELAALGRHMPCDRPIYAVQARGLDGSERPLDRLEDMAQYYLAAVRERQPHGPYALAGYSFGGLIALEMAQRLLEAGERTAIVACLDTYVHPRYWPLSARIDVLFRKARRRIRRIVTSAGGQASAGGRDQTKGGGNQPARAPVQYDNSIRRLFPVDLTLPTPLQLVYQSGLAALSRHQLRYYPGKLVYFKATDSVQYPSNPTSMWRRFVSDFELHKVSGNHLEMIGPNAKDLAAKLSRCVDQALHMEHRS
jgi:acetoacetyl-CoA synthetase